MTAILSDTDSQATQLLQQHGQALAQYFSTLGSRYSAAPKKLMDAIEYSLTAGGKRLRPTLLLECCRACESEDIKQHNRSALAAAAAIELIHTFSLVHDDLPAMDDDDLRRGRPTNHKVFGEAMAILAGDAMVTLAFEILASECNPAIAPALVKELAWASGPEGMIGGQVLDMEGENVSLGPEQLRRLHAMKTGALLVASCRLGAICAKADQSVLAAVTAYGRHLGLAFQIVDDLLDVTSTAEQMGKATRKDAHKGKNTYPSLLGIEPSRREARQQLESAIAAIEPLAKRGQNLRLLAHFVVERHK